MFPFSRTLLDFLYPPFCVGCGNDGAWLCQACLGDIPFLTQEADDVCHLAPYAHPTVRTLVTNLKYHSANSLKDSFRTLLERYPSKPDWQGTIVAVPASDKRLRERGIDQAAIIADLLRETWFPDARREVLLKRIKNTTPNAQLEDARARQGNMAGAFEATDPVSGDIILVDDVYTTGATMNACVEALKRAGADRIRIFTIAKG
jgi:ComF family protein